MNRILALQMIRPYIITNINGEQEQIGYRPILSVQSVTANVQTTTLTGNDLYGVTLTSNLDAGTCFTQFVGTYKNRLETWVELANIPNPPFPYPIQQTAYYPTMPPAAKGKLTLLDAGWSQAQGFWVTFLGNYYLGFPLFKDWSNVVRNMPNFKRQNCE